MLGRYGVSGPRSPRIHSGPNGASDSPAASTTGITHCWEAVSHLTSTCSSAGASAKHAHRRSVATLASVAASSQGDPSLATA